MGAIGHHHQISINGPEIIGRKHNACYLGLVNRYRFMVFGQLQDSHKVPAKVFL